MKVFGVLLLLLFGLACAIEDRSRGDRRNTKEILNENQKYANVYRKRKVECGQRQCAGSSSALDCVLRCVSEDCWISSHRDAILEEGEVDKREEKHKECFFAGLARESKEERDKLRERHKRSNSSSKTTWSGFFIIGAILLGQG
eukprot:TRINITY_DN13575_c0_g1_i1.p1 TRINITY_DN13575_c0_g1~~TRINITY_DN13575_c0_g1_i1.p1  ORF type:complete len:144 (-),score=11.79 TRINITY_DN13575_c0_g1_i1:74-505(-)